MGNYKSGFLDLDIKEDVDINELIPILSLASPDNNYDKKEERINKNREKLPNSKYLDRVSLDVKFLTDFFGEDHWLSYDYYMAYVELKESGLSITRENFEEVLWRCLDKDFDDQVKYEDFINDIKKKMYKKIHFSFSCTTKQYDGEIKKIFLYMKEFMEETNELVGEIKDEDGFLFEQYYYNDNILKEILETQEKMCIGCSRKPKDYKCKNYKFCIIAYKNGVKDGKV